MFNNDREDLGKKVKDWLVEAGMYRDKIPDDKANWHYVVEIGPAAVLDVVQQKGKEDMIIIASGITLSKQHYDLLRACPDRNGKSFSGTCASGCSSSPAISPCSQAKRTCRHSNSPAGLFQDGLTKQGLMDSLAMVHRCKLFVNWKMIQTFGENPKMADSSIYQ